MATLEINWDHLPRQTIERKYPPRSGGQDDGRRELPNTNSTIMSDCERESISAGEDHIKNQVEKARPILNDSEIKIDSTKTKIETNSFNDLPIDLKTSYSAELSKFKQNLEEDFEIWKNINRDMESFKDEHCIQREAVIKTPMQTIVSIVVIVVLICIEIFANTKLLAGAMVGGENEARAISVAVAGINVGISFCVGIVLLRNINHYKRGVKNFAYFLSGLYVLFYIWINFSLGVFRTKAEGYVIMANETGNSDINELLSIARDCMQPWLYITELNLTGWALVFIGITFASIGLYDGYQYSDTYPNYGRIGKKNNKTRQKALDTISTHKTNIVSLFDRFNEKAKELHKEDMENIEKWSTEVNTFQLYFNSYKEAVMQWERDLRHIIDEYRDNNLQFRQTAKPSYFDKPFEFDEKFKDASYMFSSMKNAFMEDQERQKVKNDMVTLIQGHYNTCSETLDQLKSDVENNTNDFVRLFRLN